MKPRIINSRLTKKTRKNHVCCTCGDVIKKGNKVVVNRVKIPEGIVNGYYHTENCK